MQITEVRELVTTTFSTRSTSSARPPNVSLASRCSFSRTTSSGSRPSQSPNQTERWRPRSGENRTPPATSASCPPLLQCRRTGCNGSTAAGGTRRRKAELVAYIAAWNPLDRGSQTRGHSAALPRWLQLVQRPRGSADQRKSQVSPRLANCLPLSRRVIELRLVLLAHPASH